MATKFVVTNKFADVNFLRPRLGIFALSKAQTKIYLRLSQIATSSEDSTTEGRAEGAPEKAKPPRAWLSLTKVEGEH